MVEHYVKGRRVYTADEAATLRGEKTKTLQTRLVRAKVKPAGRINSHLNVYYPEDLGIPEEPVTTLLATVDTTGAFNGSKFIAVDECRDEQVLANFWSKDLTAAEVEDGEWDAILAAAGWTVTTGWADHDGYWTAEVKRA